ncbi:MAG: EAL domain-containing protein [Lachnospiraceae bacterium]|nr:EAL domain-containing protein [Lachnospiraceae bacterium]
MQNRKKQRSATIQMILLAFLYIALTPILLGMTRYGQLSFTFGNYTLFLSHFSGIIAIMQIAICISLVLTKHKHGMVLSLSLLFFAAFGAFQSIRLTKQMSSLPGIFMSIGGIFIVLLLYKQISKLAENEQLMRELSVTDSLTGLANRRGALDFIHEMIQDNRGFYLLFLDLDHFKEINDILGHKIGDTVLCSIAKKWKQFDNYGGILARNGGDEFIFVLPDNQNIEVSQVMQQFVDASSDVHVENMDDLFNISVCIGAAHFPTNADTPEELLKCADIAMYVAKRAGNGQFRIFNDEMEKAAKRKHTLEEYIRKALENDSFYLVFQPQFSAADKSLRGFEALLRLNDEEGNPLNTGEFIDVAEHSGLILDLDNYVLEKALGIFRELTEQSDNRLILSVNISSKHLTGTDFVEEIQQILQKTCFPPSCLEIEMTEYSYVKSFRKAIQIINELTALGIKIALDDFGTGYTSLSYLTRMPVDTLKIDKSFIDNLGKNKKSEEFVNAIVSMGHILGCSVVAEGVELQEQLDDLRSYHCDYIQGFLWSKPLSFADACQLVTNYTNNKDHF